MNERIIWLLNDFIGWYFGYLWGKKYGKDK